MHIGLSPPTQDDSLAEWSLISQNQESHLLFEIYLNIHSISTIIQSALYKICMEAIFSYKHLTYVKFFVLHFLKESNQSILFSYAKKQNKTKTLHQKIRQILMLQFVLNLKYPSKRLHLYVCSLFLLSVVSTGLLKIRLWVGKKAGL